jgi:hypothetical protein
MTYIRRLLAATWDELLPTQGSAQTGDSHDFNCPAFGRFAAWVSDGRAHRVQHDASGGTRATAGIVAGASAISNLKLCELQQHSNGNIQRAIWWRDGYD